jgi:hypothetical protein
MSTRANIHFVGIYGDTEHIASNIYRHSEGYPSGLGADLHKFLDEVAKLKDTRFSDPEYLAAKFLVWQAGEYNTDYVKNETTGEWETVRCKSPLEFLSVSPCIKDHGDIEYIYKVVSSHERGERPKVFMCESCDGKTWVELTDEKHAESFGQTDSELANA